MSPMAADPSFGEGVRSGDQQTYLQQVLANTRATQQQAAQIKAQQDQQHVDTSTMEPDYKAGFLQHADGMIPGTQTAIMKNSQAVQMGHTVGNEMRSRKAEDTGAKNLGQAIDSLYPPGGPKGNMPEQIRAKRMMLDGPPSEARKTALTQLQALAAFHAPGQAAVDPNNPEAGPIPGSQIPFPGGGQEPPPRPGYIRKYVTDAHGQTSVHDDPPSMVERSALGSMKEDGWTEATPGFHTEFANRVQKMTPFTEGGGLAPRSMGFNKPPAGPAASAGATTPQAGIDTLLRQLQDPNIQPDARAAVVQALTAALGVQQAQAAQGSAQGAVPPGGPQSGLTKAPGGVLLAPQKPADSAAVKEAHSADSVLAGIEQVRKYLDDPEVKTLRGESGPLAQTLARARMYGQDKTNINLGVTGNVAAARAALATAQTEWRKSMFGVRVTQAENATIQNAISADLTDPQLPVKIAELERIMHGHRDEIDANLAVNRRQAIPTTQAGPNNTPPSTRQAPAQPTVGVSGPDPNEGRLSKSGAYVWRNGQWAPNK
jgi:hypothetical protein